jgi:hypothetical protein
MALPFSGISGLALDKFALQDSKKPNTQKASTAAGLKSDIKQIHDEVKMIRRDLEEIKTMLIQEVAPTKDETRAIEEGKKEFARGEYEDWKETRKRVVS